MKKWNARRAYGWAFGLGMLALIVLLLIPPRVRPDRYSVYDGDTLEVAPGACALARFHVGCLPGRFRLYGVDAFERTQTCRDAEGKRWDCGQAATRRLQQLVATPGFACKVDHEFVDRHAREFAVCTVGGEDVGAILVSEGLAFAYGRRTRYVAIENVAREQRRGAWAGTFVRPQYFRSGARD